MSSGYADGVDIDALFEPRQTGDPLAPDTGYQVAGVDVKNRFVAVSAGDRIPSNIAYSAAGANFRDIFAARLSVPRFPNPLPWSRTDAITASVYRHTSRSSNLNTYVQVRISIGQDGGYFIQRITPPYNSNPSTYGSVTIVSGGAGTLWSAGEMNDFQVMFEHVSGIVPTLNNGTTLGTWLSASSVSERSIFATFNVNHSSAPATYTGQSVLRINVRRVQYPSTNRAVASYTANFSLTMEAPSLESNNWSGTFSANQTDPNIRHTPEGGGINYRSASRIVFDANGTFTVQTATWNDSVTQTWSNQRTGRWLRSGTFAAADYEIIMTNADGNVSGGAGTWLNLGTSRIFQVERVVNTNSAPNTYTTSGTATFRIREISTKDWAGLVDNFIENSITMSASITIAQPVLLLSPASAFTAWAGTYNIAATVSIGPAAPPANAINTSGWGGSFSNVFSRAREIAAPEPGTLEASIHLTSTSTGAIRLNRNRFFFHGSTLPGTNRFTENVVLAEQAVINTSVGTVSDYEFRLVHQSGTVLSSNPFTNWTTFGENSSTFANFSINRGWTTNTGGPASASSTYAVEVRHKQFPTDIQRTMSYTFNNSVQLLGYTDPSPPPSGWNGTLPLASSYSDSGVIDSRQIEAYVGLLYRTDGQIRVRTNYPTAKDELVGMWSGTNANSSNTRIRATVLSQTGTVVISNPFANYSQLNVQREFTVSTTTSGSVNVRFELQSTSGGTTVTRDVAITVNRSGSSGGPGEPGGPGDDQIQPFDPNNPFN